MFYRLFFLFFFFNIRNKVNSIQIKAMILFYYITLFLPLLCLMTYHITKEA